MPAGGKKCARDRESATTKHQRGCLIGVVRFGSCARPFSLRLRRVLLLSKHRPIGSRQPRLAFAWRRWNGGAQTSDTCKSRVYLDQRLLLCCLFVSVASLRRKSEHDSTDHGSRRQRAARHRRSMHTRPNHPRLCARLGRVECASRCPRLLSARRAGSFAGSVCVPGAALPLLRTATKRTGPRVGQQRGGAARLPVAHGCAMEPPHQPHSTACRARDGAALSETQELMPLRADCAADCRCTAAGRLGCIHEMGAR
jgi:hypothetical protein